MGIEAVCHVTHGGKRRQERACLETSEVQLRGGSKLRIPFSTITSVRADKGTLILEHPGGPTSLELGEQAPVWAERIRNPRSRLEKIGVKPGQRITVVGTVEAAFLEELEAVTGRIGKLKKNIDLLFFAVDDRAQLAQIATLKTMLATDGALWIVRPKGVKSVTEADVMAAGKAAGLVDTKVVRFSETHTAEKLVIPISAR
jgi:hypothetical protein